MAIWTGSDGAEVDRWPVAGMTESMFKDLGKSAAGKKKEILERIWSAVEKDGTEYFVKPSRKKTELSLILWEKSGNAKSQRCQLVLVDSLNKETTEKYMINLGKRYAAGKIGRDDLIKDKDQFLVSQGLELKGKKKEGMKRPAHAAGSSANGDDAAAPEPVEEPPRAKMKRPAAADGAASVAMKKPAAADGAASGARPAANAIEVPQSGTNAAADGAASASGANAAPHARWAASALAAAVDAVPDFISDSL